jgi:metal-responsive CopG/Arc/MetJ family transcriptional regulator
MHMIMSMKTQREFLTRRTVLLLPPSLAEQLEQRAIRDGVSLAEVIREAVRQQLEEKP